MEEEDASSSEMRNSDPIPRVIITPTEDYSPNSPNRFQVSCVMNNGNAGYDNPTIANRTAEEVDSAHNSLPGYSPRRISLVPDYTRRRSSFGDHFTLHPEFFAMGAYCNSDTQDAFPRLEHYRHTHTVNRHVNRPTLEELRKDPLPQSRRRVSFSVDTKDKVGLIKFGWIRGVYIRCLLNIWGVMLFLRMGWMVGQAGIGGSILIILLATAVTVITTLSMSAICTNGEVRGGGAYYMISRSLGPEFGGAIGVIFYAANAVAVAMYVIGAAETVRDLLQRFDSGIVEYPSSINDVRVAGILLLILVTCVTGVGMEFENRAQIFLLITLLAALLDYFVGSCLTPTLEQRAKGFVGWNIELGKINAEPDYRGETFYSVFAVFFPSVTGILAGANISGDLRDPSMAIPKGTLLSIVSTSVSYIVIVFWLGMTMARDATGSVEDVLNGTYLNCTNRPCPHGLLNYNQVMEMSSGFGPIIFAGIFAATLSSALAALISAPRIFQAICRDGIFPILNVFAKGYGPNNDPRRAAAFTFVISILCTIIADLNAIAPIISNLFMGAHCLINFSCFHASYVKSPGFRPSFKYYNMWLSICGSILCITVMFIMSWVTALITYVIILALYIYIHRLQPAVSWGDSTQGSLFKNALDAVTKLNAMDNHIKNYRPSILVLTGNPSSRPPLVDFAYNITKNIGLAVCAHIVNETLPLSVRNSIIEHNTDWLKNRKSKVFYSLYEADSLSQGTRAMVELVGVGKLRPNVIMIGFKSKWQEATYQEIEEYLNIINVAFDMNLSLCILRLSEGLDYASYFENEIGVPFAPISGNLHDHTTQGPVALNGPPLESQTENGTTNEEVGSESDESAPPSTCGDQNNFGVGEASPSPGGMAGILGSGIAEFNAAARRVSKVVPELGTKLSRFRRLGSIEASKFHFREVPPDILNAVNQFRGKHQGTIDVWWLYDDGGLTMLIPYLLTTRAKWRECQLRVFCVSVSENTLDETQVNITSLLKKFRINFSSLTVIPDINASPSDNSKRKFQKMISKYVSESTTSKNLLAITKEELASYADRTNRSLRIRELLELHSSKASLIVMTLPMPRRQSCSSALYMAWLEILTSNMPPVLLVRGNQSSVLTFYS